MPIGLAWDPCCARFGARGAEAGAGGFNNAGQGGVRTPVFLSVLFLAWPVFLAGYILVCPKRGRLRSSQPSDGGLYGEPSKVRRAGVQAVGTCMSWAWGTQRAEGEEG